MLGSAGPETYDSEAGNVHWDNTELRYANPAYAKATEATSVMDAIQRNLELLESDQRDEVSQALNHNSAFTARLPIVVALPKLPQLPAAIPFEELRVADCRVSTEETSPEPESV